MTALLRLSLVSGIGAALVLAALLFVPTASPGEAFQNFYADSLRGELFSGYLSLGGFLFALKTFIIITMKKELYDDSMYEERFRAQRQLDCTLRRYEPLNKFRVFLSATVVVALVAAISQLTIGFIPHWVASYVCIALAVYAMILLVFALIQMWGNLHDLLAFWEQRSEKNLKSTLATENPTQTNKAN